MTVVDNQGNKTNVIVPFDEYKQIIDLLKKLDYLNEFEASLSRSLDQMNKIKSGNSPKKSLGSLIDEL
ncbi:MAG: hypothetical protein AAF828_05185 [Bacteroidota bacterium]